MIWALSRRETKIDMHVTTRSTYTWTQWRRQNFSLEGAKLKDDIKS